MGRQPAKGVEYFRHLVDYGKTIPILEARFGIVGYGVWFKILEELGKRENHALDCSDEFEWEFLLSKTMQDEDSLQGILDLCAKLDAIDRELWTSRRVIWCQHFVDNLTELYRKRKISAPEKPHSEDFRAGNPEKSEQTSDDSAESAQSREEKSREEKSREEKSREEGAPDPSGSDADDSPVFINIPTNRFKTQKEEYPVTETMIQEFSELYPGIDVRQELRNIRAWNISNPNLRKTMNGVLKHINTWLSKKQNGAKRNGSINRKSTGRTAAPNAERYQELASDYGIGESDTDEGTQ